jgi:hypothetical protein
MGQKNRTPSSRVINKKKFVYIWFPSPHPENNKSFIARDISLNI